MKPRKFRCMIKLLLIIRISGFVSAPQAGAKLTQNTTSSVAFQQQWPPRHGASALKNKHDCVSRVSLNFIADFQANNDNVWILFLCVCEWGVKKMSRKVWASRGVPSLSPICLMCTSPVFEDHRIPITSRGESTDDMGGGGGGGGGERVTSAFM